MFLLFKSAMSFGARPKTLGIPGMPPWAVTRGTTSEAAKTFENRIANVGQGFKSNKLLVYSKSDHERVRFGVKRMCFDSKYEAITNVENARSEWQIP